MAPPAKKNANSNKLKKPQKPQKKLAPNKAKPTRRIQPTKGEWRSPWQKSDDYRPKQMRPESDIPPLIAPPGYKYGSPTRMRPAPVPAPERFERSPPRRDEWSNLRNQAPTPPPPIFYPPDRSRQYSPEPPPPRHYSPAPENTYRRSPSPSQGPFYCNDWPSKPNRSREKQISDLKAIVMHRRYPEVYLTSEQMTEVEEAITNRAIKIREQPPQILSIRRERGTVIFFCAFEHSVEWLAVQVGELQGMGYPLRVELEMPSKESLLMIYVPAKLIDMPVVLRRLERQNVGLDTRKWTVRANAAQEEEDDQLMNSYELTADEASLEYFEKSNFRLFYGLGQLDLRLIERAPHRR